MQTETTATTTATPEGAAAATTAATPPATSTGTAPAPAGDSTQTTTPSTAATAATGESGKPAGEAKPAIGAPEKYEPFKLADGALSAEELAATETKARELGLSQEAAQKFAELRAADKAGFIQAQQQAVDDARATWVAEIKADKVLGGEKFAENLAVASAGLKAVDPDGAMKALLDRTGMGDHPEVIRLFHRVGKALAPDSIVPGGKAPQGARDARSFYAASNMNP